MISPSDFRNRWCDEDAEPLVVYPQDALADVAISNESRVFLTSVGLPKSAAPFLDFVGPKNGVVQTAADLWQLAPDYKRYRVIGSNGSGDPLCIDESTNGHIVYLNHDFNFRRVFINSSVPQLAESLLAYRHLVRETQRQNGEDAYLDGDIPSELQNWILREIIRVDYTAVHADCFWSHEIETMRKNST